MFITCADSRIDPCLLTQTVPGELFICRVVGNIVPRDVQNMVRAFDAGKIGEAQEWHHRLFPLCRDMLGVATNPIPIKAAMKLLGRGTGELRLPLCPLDAAAEARLREPLRNHGLLRS